MIVAGSQGDFGEQFILLGLSEVNIELLKQGKPIRCTRDSHGNGIPAGWEIAIMYGKTEQAIMDELRGLGTVTPETKVYVDPRLGQPGT